MKIENIEISEKRLRKGNYKLSHWPNGTLCHVAKNKKGEIRIFNTRENGLPSKSLIRFIK